MLLYRYCIHLLLLLLIISKSFAANQTLDNSPILPGDALPFQISIEKENLELPAGVQAGIFGVFQGQWILIGGRTNGLHGFLDVGSFPKPFQNTTVYVINLAKHQVYSRVLTDSSSGLTSEQIESLSVTDPQFYQINNTLYCVGGYGSSAKHGDFDTKQYLTAINLPGIVNWVVNNRGSVSENIKQISNPIFQVTGGALLKIGDTMQLVFGQNFTGEYNENSNGYYTEQVRRFIINNDNSFGVSILPSVPQALNPDTQTINPNFRRRDLNVIPAVFSNDKYLEYGYVAFAGVFTLSKGAWTVPVVVRGDNLPVMAHPDNPSSFKQGMNLYASAFASLYSRKNKEMYNVIFGGLTYEYFSGGTLQKDAKIPFTNQVVTIKMDNQGNFSQYLMNAEYPTIPAPIGLGYYLFGASGHFIPNNISAYPNNVINADAIRRPTVIGYIVGGIASTVLNTTEPFIQTIASPYIFKVTYIPK